MFWVVLVSSIFLSTAQPTVLPLLDASCPRNAARVMMEFEQVLLNPVCDGTPVDLADRDQGKWLIPLNTRWAETMRPMVTWATFVSTSPWVVGHDRLKFFVEFQTEATGAELTAYQSYHLLWTATRFEGLKQFNEVNLSAIEFPFYRRPCTLEAATKLTSVRCVWPQARWYVQIWPWIVGGLTGLGMLMYLLLISTKACYGDLRYLPLQQKMVLMFMPFVMVNGFGKFLTADWLNANYQRLTRAQVYENVNIFLITQVLLLALTSLMFVANLIVACAKRSNPQIQRKNCCDNSIAWFFSVFDPRNVLFLPSQAQMEAQQQEAVLATTLIPLFLFELPLLAFQFLIMQFVRAHPTYEWSDTLLSFYVPFLLHAVVCGIRLIWGLYNWRNISKLDSLPLLPHVHVVSDSHNFGASSPSELVQPFESFHD